MMEQFRFMTVDSDEPLVQRLFTAESGGRATAPGYDLTVGVTHVRPGAWTDSLRHGAVEAVAVVSGRLRLHLDKKTLVVRAGDGFLIPAGAWHCFRNTDDSAATMLFAFGGDPTPITERAPVRHTDAVLVSDEDGPDGVRAVGSHRRAKERHDESR